MEPPLENIIELLNGYRISQALSAAVQLRIADHLANGLKAPDELAVLVSAKAAPLYQVPLSRILGPAVFMAACALQGSNSIEVLGKGRSKPEGATTAFGLNRYSSNAQRLECLQLVQWVLMRMLLTHRKLLQSKAIAIDNDLRGTLRNFGLKVGMAGAVKFEARIKELVENLPDLAALVEPLLVVRRVLREQLGILYRRLLAIVRDDEVCRRLMTVPGVGPVVALTYRATVDVPARFRRSKAVGAVFGLTPSTHQSGESERTGAISRCGDEMMRVMLYEAAQIMLVRSTKWSWLKAWAMKIARRRGMKKAIVALARRLAVIMHRIWVDGTEFRWTREAAVA